MKFLATNNVINSNSGVDFLELRNSDHLKYLFKTTIAEFQQRSAIHFLLAEDYDSLAGYLPYFFLLQNRIVEFARFFDVQPSEFNRSWLVETYLSQHRLKLVNKNNSDQVHWADFNALLLSLLPRFRTLKLQKQEENAPQPERKMLSRNYTDPVSVIFFSSSNTQENEMLGGRTINGIRCTDLFYHGRIDYNNAWDGTGGLIKSRLICIEEVNMFTGLHNEAPVQGIIVTSESIASYLSDMELPADDDNIENRLKRFFGQLTAFAGALGHPPVIIAAPADQCLIFRNNAMFLDGRNDLNNYARGFGLIVLKQDFADHFEEEPIIRPLLRYQDQNEFLSNALYDLQRRLRAFADQNPDAGRINQLRTAFERLKGTLLSRLPGPMRILNRLHELKEEVIALQLMPNEEEGIIQIIGDLENIRQEFRQAFENEIVAVPQNRLTLYSDNSNDYIREANRQWDVDGKNVSVRKLNWNDVNIADNEVADAVIYTFSLPERRIYGAVYSGLFTITTSNTLTRQYLLLSKRDMFLVYRIIRAFEKAVEFFRPVDAETVDTPIISEEAVNEQAALAMNGEVENVDQLIEQALERMRRRLAGIRRYDSPAEAVAVNITYIDQEQNLATLYEVPAGRLFNLVDEEESNDNRKKRADELEPGDQILLIFDNRDNTYEELRGHLCEINANGFEEKYQRGLLWIQVLDRYRNHLKANGHFTMQVFVNSLVEYGMRPVTTATVANWLRDRNVLPDNFRQLIGAIINLIHDNPGGIFTNENYIIGDVENYVNVYTEVWNTPRILYRSIVRRIRNQEDLDYSIRRYEQIFNALVNRSRVLTVDNID